MQAVVRLEPDLRDKPVAILAGAPPLTKVFAVNREARNLGVETGMTKVQAEAFKGIVLAMAFPFAGSDGVCRASRLRVDDFAARRGWSKA